MSNEVTVPAYKTKLGNSTAKSVLVLLADHSNSDGFSFPSVDTIASRTELSVRQVLRLLQVFEEIGLVERKKVKDRQYTNAFQINLGMLESDLRGEFRVAFLAAQGKNVSETNVAETPKDVSETVKSVSETVPPHPLIGVTVIEPPKTRRTPKKAVATALSIPAWLDAEAWTEYREMRKRIRAPMTPHAEKLMLDRLLEHRANGHSPKLLLERAIVNCWKDVYPDTGGRTQQRPPVKLVETEFKK